MSPRVYRMLQASWVDTGMRSIQYVSHYQLSTLLMLSRQQSAKVGRFQVGIVDVNFDSAKKWVEQLGYVGPLVTGAFSRRPALEPYKDGDVWKVAGIQGESQVFKD